jgi:hypothetical protein
MNSGIRINKVIMDKDIISIVSGVPRSGTSMMMRILEAGGLPVITDETRRPDEDNPNGYYEFEEVKKIKDDSSWIPNCRGKAIKMVSDLLWYLPANEKYRVIFMLRDMEEILASQKKMLKRLGRYSEDVSDAEMGAYFTKHLKKVGEYLLQTGYIETIYVHYNEVIKTSKQLSILNDFYGSQLSLDRMVGVVDQSLYRERRNGRNKSNPRITDKFRPLPS